MHKIKGLIEAVRAEWNHRMQRRRSANRAIAVAFRMAMNGCRL